MLITELKSKEALAALVDGKKVFIINCHGCKEVSFPEKEAEEFAKELGDQVTGILTTDYICNTDNLPLRLEKHTEAIEKADVVLVLSCGVGVQTIAGHLPEKKVCAACDTYALPGHQGVTPLEHNCDQCGQCYLNITGGICPITACSKSLVNGQCGGAKNGKCEVDPNMDCGWEMIQRRLQQVGRTDMLKCPVNLRQYNK